MKPSSFKVISPTTVGEAINALIETGENGKLLAGGQSLVPMLNFRLIDVPVFVDINGIAELSGIEKNNRGLQIGALTRHYEVETSELVKEYFPVLSEAMRFVGHIAIRNRGTIGGSLAHADPAAEWPAIAQLLDAELTIVGPTGSHNIPAREFFIGPLETVLEDSQILVSVDFPALPSGSGWGFEEMANRHGDFAVAGASAIVVKESERIVEARIVLFGVHDTPLRVTRAETLLVAEGVDAAAAAAKCQVEPLNDLHGTAEYRRHLTEVLTRRVLHSAIKRAES